MAGSCTSAPRDGHTLLHTARQLPRILPLEALEADEREEIDADLLVPLAAQALDVDGQQHVVEHVRHGNSTGDWKTTPMSRRGPAMSVPPQHRLAARGRQDSREDLQQGGLAAARGPDDGDELALADGKRGALERGTAPSRVALRLRQVRT